MSIDDQLLDQFSKAGKQEWLKAAASEIDGKDALEALQWQAGNVTFLPYYDSENQNDLRYLEKFHFPNQSSEFHSPRFWQNVPNVSVKDEKTANAIALDHLKNGADGILFTLSSPSINFHTLLDKIEWPHCSLFFIADSFSDESLTKYLYDKKFEREVLSGAVFRNNISFSEIRVSGLRRQGILVPQASPVTEIAFALTTGANIIHELQQKGFDTRLIVQQIGFSVSVTSSFLTEISKLKALRMVWYQVVRAFGVEDYQPDDLLLHTRSEVWINEKFQPHGNLINSTISSLAAVAGGSNAHTVYAEQENDRLMSRIARNNSILLKDESHVGKVSDPLAGTYAIENMTHELARAAWKKFQEQI